jgi:hypothetical protein
MKQEFTAAYVFGLYFGEKLLLTTRSLIQQTEYVKDTTTYQLLIQPFMSLFDVIWQFVEGLTSGFLKPLLVDQLTLQLLIQAASSLLRAIQLVLDSLIQQQQQQFRK